MGKYLDENGLQYLWSKIQDLAEGRQIELQKSDTHILWKYVDDSDWIELVSLEELKGQSFYWRHDEWVDTAQYGVGDVIALDGSSYACKVEHTANSTNKPETGPYWNSYWFLMARRGADGENGLDGADGQSAYEAAVAGGYLGTEEDFYADLSSIQSLPGGDMMAETYDPTGIAGDVFSMDNMVETETAKIMTAEERSKLDGIEAGAQKNVQSDWNASSGDAFIKNKPTLGSLAAKSSIGTNDIDSGAITSDKMASMSAYTVKGRNSSTAGTPSDVTMQDVVEYGLYQGTTTTSISNSEYIPITESATSAKKITWSNFKSRVKEYLDDYYATSSDITTAVSGKADKAIERTATLTAAGWTGSSAPYTQTVTVSGLSSNAKGSIGIDDSATDEQYQAAVSAQLRKTAQATNSVTIKAYGEKPTVNIPIIILEVN